MKNLTPAERYRQREDAVNAYNKIDSVKHRRGHEMTEQEYQHQNLERQQFNEDMDASEGVPDFGYCEGYGHTEPCTQGRRVTRWTAEGFTVRFGKELAEPFLKQIIDDYGNTHYDTDQICLCHECEYHTENWEADHE